MPAIQTTYPNNIGVAKAGQIVNEELNNLISRNVENAGGLAFGAAAAQGTSDLGVHTWTTGDTKFVGVAVRERSINPANTDAVFAQNDTARLITKGVIWVPVGENVAAGDPVYLTAAGAWMKTATSNTLVSNARWDTTATNGNLARLRLA